MKKKIWELGMTLLLLIGVFWLARTGARFTAGDAGESRGVVLIDSGHGGSDPGKIGIHQEKEKDINLQIAKKLKKQLEKNQVKVYMTRETDEDLSDHNGGSSKVQDLRNRCEMIREIQPDCVLSIHQNSYPEEAVYGAQVFYYEDSTEGKKLAEILQKYLVEKLDPTNHRQAKGNKTYYMLKKTEATLVIVECGFLSNDREASLLSDNSYQKKVAKAICEGTMEYLSQNTRQKNSGREPGTEQE